LTLCTEAVPQESKKYLETHLPCTISTVDDFPGVLEGSMAPFLQPAHR
jgi:hypothetical protein